MKKNERMDKFIEIHQRIWRSLSDIHSGVLSLGMDTDKLPGCLNAIHDQLIELETELGKSLQYQSRSAEALEKIAYYMAKLANTYDTQFHLDLDEKDEV